MTQATSIRRSLTSSCTGINSSGMPTQTQTNTPVATLSPITLNFGDQTGGDTKEGQAQRRTLRERLEALERRPASRPLSVDTSAIRAHLEHLDGLLKADPDRANAFFRQHVAPMACTPVTGGRHRFCTVVDPGLVFEIRGVPLRQYSPNSAAKEVKHTSRRDPRKPPRVTSGFLSVEASQRVIEMPED
jgi:hypothetical protein